MFGRRRKLEERIELLRLDLARVEGASSLTNLLLATLVQQGNKTMSQLDDIITSLNDNTNQVASRLDHMIAQLQTTSQAPTAGQLQELQAISDHLKALGSDTTNPIPGAQVPGVMPSVPGMAASSTAVLAPLDPPSSIAPTHPSTEQVDSNEPTSEPAPVASSDPAPSSSKK